MFTSRTKNYKEQDKEFFHKHATLLIWELYYNIQFVNLHNIPVRYVTITWLGWILAFYSKK